MSRRGDIDLALIDLSSIVSYDESSGEHTSFVKFFCPINADIMDSTLIWQVRTRTLSVILFNGLKGPMAYEGFVQVPGFLMVNTGAIS